MDDQLAPWLRLTLIPGLGGESQRKLLRAFGPPDAVFAASRIQLRSLLPAAQADLVIDHENREQVEHALAWARQKGQWIITLGDELYPSQLLEIPDPPTLLYGRGDPTLLNRPALGVIGSRNATPQGLKTARQFSRNLAQQGLAIVSGMALGIDAEAHWGALEGNGPTIAVIGTGADRIYPARNKELAQRIAASGAIISEFPLGTPSIGSNFPRRNRIIAGLSKGVLVVEAAVESGSLITARLALEQGREVFAIPGSIHSPVSRGCHRLIKQGAKLVETAQDVLDEFPSWVPTPFALRPEPASPDNETSTDEASDWLLDALGHTPCTLDELVQRTSKPAELLLPLLLQYELQGLLASLPGNSYQRLS